MQQHREARRALDQGADRRTAKTEGEVSLPMSQYRSIGCFGGALTDHDPRRDKARRSRQCAKNAPSKMGYSACASRWRWCIVVLRFELMVECGHYTGAPRPLSRSELRYSDRKLRSKNRANAAT